MLSNVICIAAGATFPAYISFKVLQSGDPGLIQQWLTFWTVNGWYLTAQLISDYTLFWIPFYNQTKIAFVLWLVFFHGATFLYLFHLQPFLVQHERRIDGVLARSRDLMSFGFTQLVDFSMDWGRLALSQLLSAAGFQFKLSPRLRRSPSPAKFSSSPSRISELSDDDEMYIENHEDSFVVVPQRPSLQQVARPTFQRSRIVKNQRRNSDSTPSDVSDMGGRMSLLEMERRRLLKRLEEVDLNLHNESEKDSIRKAVDGMMEQCKDTIALSDLTLIFGGSGQLES
ncbi:TB2/DP1, HVA22 family-domain-containing protein [Cladochytrium replicatum]|nr:TB2/DP1, HVA22 family-domain-containing protein [Cladochytrium replicatum]